MASIAQYVRILNIIIHKSMHVNLVKEEKFIIPKKWFASVHKIIDSRLPLGCIACYLPNYFDAATKSCLSCPKNQVFNPTENKCIRCPSDRPITNGAACTQCPTDTYFNSTTQECQKCSGGRNLNRTTNKCECPTSQFFDGTTCIFCYLPKYFDVS